ncbi:MULTISPECIES: hypothetical protein [Mesonia]|uniref:Uncharacterized protein n=1 Tax=Mesonia oceanica TaxID=2687242 RepID=A0AC61Y4P3_9FLAO|nr:MULTISPECIES: hypothetical protein [Mesonia]MAN26565.1 hypothetical protein [Mesonia sp.]MAQ40833.1 hypothetical protein [Mesonia sp.]MBJ97754.1 hypothetical protein [Flavobacteriaceae bacterium]VVU99460.1 hypothetical protein FVB9532_00714 [Mesonia oceanica]|tara:strand:+ start:31360 stop:32190 length:831 start_codon:yes stop_codon:yes gene_type:complete
MKLPKYLFYFLVSFAIISCSDDDNNDAEETISNHFPLTVGNSWTYNNETTYQDGASTNSQETLTVESTSEEQGVTYYKLESDASINEKGFFTGILTAGSLIMADNQLIYNGELSVDLSGFGLDLDNLSIPLNNIIVFDAEANSGENLTQINDVITRNVNLPQVGTVPFTIEYNLRTVQNEFLNSYTVNEEEFQDVLSAGIIVNLEISVSLSGFQIPILQSQDAIQMTNYYADNVGLIKSETSINYDFEELNFPNIPSIPDFSMEETQEIETYIVAE